MPRIKVIKSLVLNFELFKRKDYELWREHIDGKIYDASRDHVPVEELDPQFVIAMALIHDVNVSEFTHIETIIC